MVGCVIVNDNKIISEGFHIQYGGAHAEVNAIDSAIARGLSSLFSESVLYVNLEPCSHYGKTPPCAIKVAENRFKKVVIACNDPNPRVNGKGVALLRERGIEVVENVLYKEARFFNRRFFTSVENKRPYIILKWAQTADGFIAPEGGNSECQITDERLKIENHKLRAKEDAIFVGTNTLKVDNPRLNARLYQGRQPYRVSVDFGATLDFDLHFFDGSQPTILFVKNKNLEHFASVQGKAEIIPLEDNECDWKNIGSVLAQKGIASMVVEGGACILNSLIDADYYDEIMIFESSCLWGKGYAAPQIPSNLNSYKKDMVYGSTPSYPCAQRIRFLNR